MPSPRCIAVDVDGTLFSAKRPRRVNRRLVSSVRAKANEGWDVIVWSMRGSVYARRAARAAGLDDVAVCVSKPGVIVDDIGLDWLRGCRVVRP